MRTRKPKSESGYVLLALLLFVALLSIAMLSIVNNIKFQMQRDHEEELIHRGVQYSRAVRKYFKAFGRYPTRVEELENTNNQRFLRHRYKDPITGKDFKLLRLGDVQMSFGALPGVPVADMNQQQGAPGALSNLQQPLGAGPSAIMSQNAPVETPGDASQGDQTGTGQQGDQNAAGNQGGTPPPPQPLSQQSGANGAPQVFGGGGIVGVASVSKDKTIREFNKKNHYNQWQFIYDPTTDRGGLLMTPNQPPLMINNNPNQPQTGQTPGQNNPGSGNDLGQQPGPPGK